VAFHHAGISAEDRSAVEQAFLRGDINVICSTSTLAVGINLPCYLVILQGTVGYADGGPHEYSDLEVMQMLGRAGRPQFEQSACAVIMTRQESVTKYRTMVSGQSPLESTLHRNLIEHLNAEIGLGTVHDLSSAKKWLSSTFLYVRLGRNPKHYHLDQGSDSLTQDELLEQICEKDVDLLLAHDCISDKDGLRTTELGDAMARYYVKFETMKMIAALPPRARMSEIVSRAFYWIAIADNDSYRYCHKPQNSKKCG
jgi:ATP-dependent DNA helicase HFM1/MER3